MEKIDNPETKKYIVDRMSDIIIHYLNKNYTPFDALDILSRLYKKLAFVSNIAEIEKKRAEEEAKEEAEELFNGEQ